METLGLFRPANVKISPAFAMGCPLAAPSPRVALVLLKASSSFSNLLRMKSAVWALAPSSVLLQTNSIGTPLFWIVGSERICRQGATSQLSGYCWIRAKGWVQAAVGSYPQNSKMSHAQFCLTSETILVLDRVTGQWRREEDLPHTNALQPSFSEPWSQQHLQGRQLCVLRCKIVLHCPSLWDVQECQSAQMMCPCLSPTYQENWFQRDQCRCRVSRPSFQIPLEAEAPWLHYFIWDLLLHNSLHVSNQKLQRNTNLSCLERHCVFIILHGGYCASMQWSISELQHHQDKAQM